MSSIQLSRRTQAFTAHRCHAQRMGFKRALATVYLKYTHTHTQFLSVVLSRSDGSFFISFCFQGMQRGRWDFIFFFLIPPSFDFSCAVLVFLSTVLEFTTYFYSPALFLLFCYFWFIFMSVLNIFLALLGLSVTVSSHFRYLSLPLSLSLSRLILIKGEEWSRRLTVTVMENFLGFFLIVLRLCVCKREGSNSRLMRFPSLWLILYLCGPEGFLLSNILVLIWSQCMGYAI